MAERAERGAAAVGGDLMGGRARLRPLPRWSSSPLSLLLVLPLLLLLAARGPAAVTALLLPPGMRCGWWGGRILFLGLGSLEKKAKRQPPDHHVISPDTDTAKARAYLGSPASVLPPAVAGPGGDRKAASAAPVDPAATASNAAMAGAAAISNGNPAQAPRRCRRRRLDC
jgi:hypothetical protein